MSRGSRLEPGGALLPADEEPRVGASKRTLRSFLIIWGGQAASILGSQLVQFALIWYLAKETGSATALALASLVGLLPTVLVGPIAGTLVDRWNRRLIMIAADTVVALATGVLVWLFAANLVQVWHIYLVVLARAIGGAFHHPAMTASTALMVPRQHLTRIAGLNQMLTGGLSIIAAPLGALLVEALPMQGILAIDIGTAAVAVLPLLFLAVPQPVSPNAAGSLVRGMAADFGDGLRTIWDWRGLRQLVFMAVLINALVGPAFSLLPLLVTEHFGGGALQLGWLQSTLGIGTLAGGLLLSVWGGFRRQMVTSLTGLFTLGFGTVALGLVPAGLFPLAVTAMLILGLGLPITNGPIVATLQTIVPPEKQGRVFTLVSSLSTGIMPLALLVAGPLADLMSVRTWLVLAGIFTVLAAFWARVQPSLMAIDTHHLDSIPTPKPAETLAPQHASVNAGTGEVHPQPETIS